MAQLRQKTDSPYWHLRYWDAKKGRRCQRSTGLRVKSRDETREARRLQDEMTEMELQANGKGKSERWDNWVTDFLKSKYSQPSQARTLERYLGAWKNLNEFLNLKGIKIPSQLKREHALEYFRWRQEGV